MKASIFDQRNDSSIRHHVPYTLASKFDPHIKSSIFITTKDRPCSNPELVVAQTPILLSADQGADLGKQSLCAVESGAIFGPLQLPQADGNRTTNLHRMICEG